MTTFPTRQENLCKHVTTGWSGSTTVSNETPFSEMDTTTIKNYCDARTDKILWTLTATVTGTYGTYTAQSDIVLAAVDGWDQVEEITLDPSEIVFS